MLIDANQQLSLIRIYIYMYLKNKDFFQIVWNSNKIEIVLLIEKSFWLIIFSILFFIRSFQDSKIDDNIMINKVWLFHDLYSYY